MKILGVTGGIPKYLEEISPKYPADDNIKALCFEPSGSLVAEFKNIFSDLFSKRSGIYEEIVRVLADGVKTFEELIKSLKFSKSGFASTCFNNLVQAGFISRDHTWSLKTGKPSRLSHYRLSDNYLRFYLKYIEKNMSQIEQGHFNDIPISSLPFWMTIMGLQFENIILNNRPLIWKQLHLSSKDIVCDNPFFQRRTLRARGCQIDYLIQTRFNTLYVCEIKFSKNEIGSEIIEEMKQKINSLALPRGYACSPVLIHSSHVSETVSDSEFFSHIIHVEELVN